MPDYVEFQDITHWKNFWTPFSQTKASSHQKYIAHTISHLISTTHLKPHAVNQILEIPLKQLLEFKLPSVEMGPSLGAARKRTKEQIAVARQQTVQTLQKTGCWLLLMETH